MHSNHSPIYPIHNTVGFDELRAATQYRRHVSSGVQQVLPQVAAKHPLLEDAALLQAPARRPVQNKTPKERDQLAVPAQHRFDGAERQGPTDRQTKCTAF